MLIDPLMLKCSPHPLPAFMAVLVAAAEAAPSAAGPVNASVT